MSKAPLFAIVDDDAALREALAELFEVFDLDCRSYVGSEDFLADYTPGRFSAVVTDLNLLGESGLQLQQRLKIIEPGLAVIIISAQSDPLTRARVLASGPMAFLTKPINDAVLHQHLCAAISAGGRPPAAG